MRSRKNTQLSRATTAGMADMMSPAATAELRLRRGAGWALRREAVQVRPDPEHDGWDLVSIGFSDPERLADRVCGHGADAVVLAPQEARAAVVARLRALAAAGAA